MALPERSATGQLAFHGSQYEESPLSLYVTDAAGAHLQIARGIRGLEGIEALDGLIALDLSDNSISDVTALSTLRQLRFWT